MTDTPDIEPHELIDQLLQVAREARERTDPFPPIITWQSMEGPAIIADLAEVTDFTGDLGHVFAQLRDLVGEPAWFAVTLDSYARDQEPGSPQPDPGELEQAFKNGDMSVVEQLVTILMPPDRELVMFRQLYRYTPVDGWEWSESQVVQSPDDAVCTAVRMFH